MSVMGFQKSLDMGGWGELYPSFFWIFGIFSTLQSPFSWSSVDNSFFLNWCGLYCELLFRTRSLPLCSTLVEVPMI